MYWIYLTIFVLAVLTPEMIDESGSILFFGAEDFESLVIFFLGTFGFILYLVKEKALLQALKDRLHLQKQANIITRDLSDSYSYIGEMNRKFDIVKELIFRLPKDTAEALGNNEKRQAGIYRSVIEAVHLLSKARSVSLCFVNLKTNIMEKTVGEEHNGSISPFSASDLTGSKKLFCEDRDCVIVRSPRQAYGVTAFIIFRKATNHTEDVEIFKILASEALFLYCVERHMLPEHRSAGKQAAEENKKL